MMDDNISKLCGSLYMLAGDINPAEIASQIERDNLSAWCNNWRIAIKQAINALART